MMPQKGLATWPTLNRVLKQLAAALGVRISIDGAEESRAGDGDVYFRVQPGGAASGLHPWKAHVVEDVLVMAGGVYNGWAVEQQELAGSGWAYLVVTWDVSDTDDGWLLSATLDDVEFTIGPEVPPANPGSGTWYVPLVQFDGLEVLSQAETASFSATVCDDGSGSGLGAHIILR